MLDAAGNLYGTTADGGTGNYGTVFEIAQGTGAITTLATFDGTDGNAAAGGVVLDSAGNLYGTAGSLEPARFSRSPRGAARSLRLPASMARTDTTPTGVW